MYTSCNLQPDHTTLSRFRKNNLDLISDIFVQIIRLAQEKEISEFKHITIDGTKIQAASSPKRSKDAEGLDRYLAAVRKNIAEYMEQCDQFDQDSDNYDISSISTRLKKLKELEKTLIERKAELEQRKQQIKKDNQKTHQINITEPDAFNMRHANGKQTLPGYNAQASVDDQSELIVVADLVQERTDFNQFSTQHQAVENNLGNDPDRQYTADSGYHNIDQLEYIKKHQIDAVLNDPVPEARSVNKEPLNVKELQESKHKLTRSDFIYNPEGNHYACPAGRLLEFSHSGKSRNRMKWHYRSRNCESCVLLNQCLASSNKSGFRTITRDHNEILAEQMSQKLQTEQAQQRLFIRKTTVEPVFGNLKHNLGYRRFTLRGLENVKNEFKLMAIGHNLNKLFKYKDKLMTTIEHFLYFHLTIFNMHCHFV
jgi:hypothetical protein